MTELNRILHLEDDPGIQQVVEMALAMVGGFTLRQADSGFEGVEVVSEFGPQLMLCDVQMPGMTGPEAMVQIREKPGFENIPAIYLTARVTEARDALLVHSQDLDIIPKPFDPTTLADEIRAIWAAREVPAS